MKNQNRGVLRLDTMKTLARLALCCSAALLVFSLTACLSNRDAIAQGLPAPDRGLVLREETNQEIYIWDCFHGKHIVIFRLNAGFYATDYERQEASCGDKTPKEQSIALTGLRTNNRNPMIFWGH